MKKVRFHAPYGQPVTSPIKCTNLNGWTYYELVDTIGRPVQVTTGTLIWEPPNCDGVNPQSVPGSSTVQIVANANGRTAAMELDRARVDWLIDILRVWRETGKLP